MLRVTNKTESYVDVFEVGERGGNEAQTLLDLHNKNGSTMNSDFVVSFIEQMMKHYKIEVSVCGRGERQFTKRDDYKQYIPQIEQRISAMKVNQGRSVEMSRYLTKF